MAENSKIEWTDHTFNPWIGCQKVGPGCDHCYAEALSKARLGVAWGPSAERRRTKPANWKKPILWNRKADAEGVRYRVFCASLADVFDNAVDPAWRRDLFHLVLETPNLDWLLLTKRIGNVDKMLTDVGFVPGNIWLGITVVNQAEADRDIPKLLQAPGIEKRFLSMEPLLGPVDLTRVCLGEGDVDQTAPHAPGLKHVRFTINALAGVQSFRWPAIDWVIVGGESGSGARPMHPSWARSLRDQCASAGTPFLFKQWGEHIAHPAPGATWWDGTPVPEDLEPVWFERVGKKIAGRLLDGFEHNGRPQ